jgi:hypothetical protein
MFSWGHSSLFSCKKSFSVGVILAVIIAQKLIKNKRKCLKKNNLGKELQIIKMQNFYCFISIEYELRNENIYFLQFIWTEPCVVWFCWKKWTHYVYVKLSLLVARTCTYVSCVDDLSSRERSVEEHLKRHFINYVHPPLVMQDEHPKICFTVMTATSTMM